MYNFKIKTCMTQMRNISREMETMKKNQMKNLQLKNKISEGKKKKEEQGLSHLEYKQSNDHVTGVLENKTMKDWDRKIFEKIKAEI